MTKQLPTPKSNKQKKAHLQHKAKQKDLAEKKERTEAEAAKKLEHVMPKKIRNVKTIIEEVFNATKPPPYSSPFQPVWDILHPPAHRMVSKQYKDFLKSMITHLIDCRVNIFKTKGHANSLQGPLKVIVNLCKYHGLHYQPIEEWKPNSHNTERQLSSVMRHLYAKYEVPLFMDKAWTQGVDKHCEWFLHLGEGGNIRTALGLPVAITKRQAHHFMQAPKDFEILGAIRYGQIVMMGGNERICRQILGTRVGTDFTQEEFWHTIFAWFLANPMLDTNQYAPIIDYIYNMKYVSDRLDEHGNMVPHMPGFSIKNRDPEQLLNQVQEWHKRLGRHRTGNFKSWRPCGIPGLYHEVGQNNSKKIFTIRELCTQGDLSIEGDAMRHCVSSYAASCSSGGISIWSMEEGARKMVTIEVSNPEKKIVQARGKYNEPAKQQDLQILRTWADKAGLTISRWLI